MVRITDKKLVIEVEHPAPDDFLADLRLAIIEAIQNQPEVPINPEGVHQTNHTLLEVLKNLERK